MIASPVILDVNKLTIEPLEKRTVFVSPEFMIEDNFPSLTQKDKNGRAISTFKVETASPLTYLFSSPHGFVLFYSANEILTIPRNGEIRQVRPAPVCVLPCGVVWVDPGSVIALGEVLPGKRCLLKYSIAHQSIERQTAWLSSGNNKASEMDLVSVCDSSVCFRDQASISAFSSTTLETKWKRSERSPTHSGVLSVSSTTIYSHLDFIVGHDGSDITKVEVPSCGLSELLCCTGDKILFRAREKNRIGCFSWSANTLIWTLPLKHIPRTVIPVSSSSSVEEADFLLVLYGQNLILVSVAEGTIVSSVLDPSIAAIQQADRSFLIHRTDGSTCVLRGE